ncbi:MAG: FG-GAP repeat domain-containing protein [Bryobacteraceae bacterium]
MSVPVFLLMLALACAGVAAPPPLALRAHLIRDDLKAGYQVAVADLNRDRRPDLVALASGARELAWFENPGWQRYIIVEGLQGMINAAAADTDGDGMPEIVLAWEFSMRPRESAGVIGLLRASEDPRRPWSLREIDRLPTSHRLAWTDIEGKRPGVLVNAPLAGAAAEPPEYLAPVPLVMYRPGEWKRETISDQLQGVLHGIAVTDFDGDGREDILTASFRGLDLFTLTPQGWRRMHLADGNPAPWPRSGASEVAVGRLRQGRFLAAVEPWHGNMVTVYLPAGSGWRRVVIDDSLAEGHALATADFDGDGRDEIVAGFRAQGGGLYVYRATDARGENWLRQPLDSGKMATSSCVVADLNLDRRPDLACIGGSHLMWFENLAGRRSSTARPGLAEK